MCQFDVTNGVEHHEARYLERIIFHCRKQLACGESKVKPRITHKVHRLGGVVFEHVSVRVRERLRHGAGQGHQPVKGQGHLHYQVDDGPIVATTVPKLSFHGLKPGTHSIMVQLAANDHTPLGPEQKLSVTIP